ncbi:hypothetical protein [Amycolatopsis australiensis]|uniref:Uncharacterized protein n=1 Tax=Amycolatopsis australiensis TaxID=546364 RepID=A0A1K1LLB3_9PSEU|nr:hypothetical protein [Amycolatopsis australiensis]SFW11693.1 hypothetical protein SAMN04489730_0048 [Amycolatopsis australiensis]
MSTTTEFPAVAEPAGTESAGPDGGLRPRLRGRYADYLRIGQTLADLAMLGLAGAVFYLMVFTAPAQLLWPGATGGTPQHWGAGIAVAVLLLAGFGYSRAAIQENWALTHHLDGVTAYQLWEINRDSRALERRIFVVDFAFTALLLYPALPVAVALWHHNDPAELAVLGPQLAVRVVPIASVVLLRILIGHGLHALVNVLQDRQEIAARERHEIPAA